jgi:hypothetical protein
MLPSKSFWTAASKILRSLTPPTSSEATDPHAAAALMPNCRSSRLRSWRHCTTNLRQKRFNNNHKDSGNTKQVGSNGNISDLYSGGAQLNLSQVTNCPEVLVVSFSPSRQMLGQYHKWGHDLFLLHHFQLNFRHHSLIQCYIIRINVSITK